MTMQETLTLLPEWLIWWFNWLVFAVAVLPLALLIWPQSRKVGVIAVAASILTGAAVYGMFRQMGYVKLLGLPHLLIWGAEDTALLPEATAGLETFAPDLTRIEIEGADHWLHHQKPSVVAKAILDWCRARPL